MKVRSSPMGENPVETGTRLRCPVCLAAFRTWFDCCPADGGTLAPWEGDPLIGTEVAGRYIIEELIGEGSMGLIYRARHVCLPRWFAVKILFGDLVANPRMRMRFAREASLASRLSHPNVIPVVDFGRSASGLLYLVMDFVEGKTLGHLIAREAPLDQVHAIRLAWQLAQGLGHAHKRGLVHRDFKPDNVLLEPYPGALPVPRILDFGLAISSDGEERSGRLTETGFVIGTPVYIAPEQVMDRVVDHRADLFALGVVLYEMLAGKPPFDGRPVEIAHRNVIEQVPPIGLRTPGVDIAPQLERVIHCLLAKEPADRFGSADELCAALEAVESQLLLDRKPAAELATDDQTDPPGEGGGPKGQPNRLADDLLPTPSSFGLPGEETLDDPRGHAPTETWSRDTTTWSLRLTPTLGKLAVMGAFIFAVGVVAYGLAHRRGRTRQATRKPSAAMAAGAQVPAPPPGAGPARTPAGAPVAVPLIHPLSSDAPATGSEPRRTVPVSPEQARPEELPGRDDPTAASISDEPARRHRRTGRGAKAARALTRRDPDPLPGASPPPPARGAENQVLPTPPGAAPRAEPVRQGRSVTTDAAGAPRAADSAPRPAGTSRSIAGVQAQPVPQAEPGRDPAGARPLAQSLPSGPIVVPPWRTRREGGSTPPVRFPPMDRVPREITVRLCIDPVGKVTSVTVLSQLSARGRAAVEKALSQWRYHPVVERGEKVAACFATTFRVQED